MLENKLLIMGIINITPDSFSDGGLYLDPESSLRRAISCINDGANILDLGAQSTRPGADYISEDIEVMRLLPCLKKIRSGLPNSIISIDTFHSKVAKSSLEHGANLINDISGGRYDKDMAKLIGDAGCNYVITHSRGNSKTMNSLAVYKDVVNEVFQELLKLTDHAISNGVQPNQIIWDPGLGFAKNNEHNLTILRNLEKFTSEQFPVLLGPSRKRFIGHVLNEENPNKRIYGTSAVVCRCIDAKVDMVRVHDVYEISQVISMSSQIW